MNQVNPLHIGGLLVVIIIFLFFKLNGIKEELADAKSEFVVSEALAIDLNTLKSVYGDKNRIKKSLERILNQPSIKETELKTKYEKKFMKITAKEIETKALNSLMGKVLNASFNISALKIKRLNDTQASLEMEIKW